MPTAGLSPARSPAPPQTDPGRAGESLRCPSEGRHRGKALGQAEREGLAFPGEGDASPITSRTVRAPSAPPEAEAQCPGAGQRAAGPRA